MWATYLAKNKFKKFRSGFTIVELLIVVVVIAILASITIVSYNGIQERAKVSSANSDLVYIKKAIYMARESKGSNLMTITGTSCTSCNDTTGSRMAGTLDKISAASGANLSKLKAGDPWGNPYTIDENEGEGANPCNNRDFVGQAVTRAGVSGEYIPYYAC